MKINTFLNRVSSINVGEKNHIQERREGYISNNPSTSYSKMDGSKKERNIYTHSRNNWNGDEHNKHLLSPNGRASDIRHGFSSFSQSNPYGSTGTDSSAHPREELLHKTLQDIILVASYLWMKVQKFLII